MKAKQRKGSERIFLLEVGSLQFFKQILKFTNTEQHNMEYFSELTEKLAQISKGELQQDSIRFYQNNYQGITHFVKILKREEHGAPNFSNLKEKDLVSLGELLANFLSQKKAYQNTLFLEALAALDCILSYIPTTLCKISMSQNFALNLRKFFIKTCEKYDSLEEPQREKCMQFQFYSVFYIIVMSIYQSGKCQNQKLKKMPLQIMGKAFLNQLFNLELPNRSRVKKLVGFIMVYLVKRISMKTYGRKMFNFIITECQSVQNKRVIFNFIFCIREINLQCPIQLADIHKHNLLLVLRKVWQMFSDEYQIIYVVDLVERILKNHPQQAKNFITEQIAINLGSPSSSHLSHPLFSDIALSLLKLSVESISKETLTKIVNMNIPTLNQNEYSIKIVSSFIDKLPSSALIRIVHSGIMVKINELFNSFDQIHKYQAMQILETLLLNINRVSEDYAVNIYYKMRKNLVQMANMIEMKSSVQRLQRIYQKKPLEFTLGFSLI